MTRSSDDILELPDLQSLLDAANDAPDDVVDGPCDWAITRSPGGVYVDEPCRATASAPAEPDCFHSSLGAGVPAKVARVASEASPAAATARLFRAEPSPTPLAHISEALAKGGISMSAASVNAASLAAAAEEVAAAVAAASASAVTIPAPRLAAKGDGAAKNGGQDVSRRAAGAPQQPVSHSSVEKQRRDRLNELIEELGELAPAAPAGADNGAKRAKHIILSDAAAALRRLYQENQMLRTHLAGASRMLAAAAAVVNAAGATTVATGAHTTAAPAAATATAADAAPTATSAASAAAAGGSHGADAAAGDMLQRSDSGGAFGVGAAAAGNAGAAAAVADCGRTGSGPVSLPLPTPAYGSLPELPGALSASFAAAAALQLPRFPQPSPSPPPPPPPPAVAAAVGAAHHQTTTALTSSPPPAAAAAVGEAPALAPDLAAVTGSTAAATHAPSWLVRVVCPPHAGLVAVATAALTGAGPPGSVALRGVRLVPRASTTATQAPLVSVEMTVSCECALLPRIQQCVSAAVNTLASCCANKGVGSSSSGSGSGGGGSAVQPPPPQQQPVQLQP